MPHTQDIPPNLAATLTGPHHRMLARFYQHPVSHNLSWREAEALFASIGDVDHAHNGDVVFTLHDERLSFRPAKDKDLAVDDVMELRHMLTRHGWALDAPAPVMEEAETPDLVIVIDHAGARIYSLFPEDGHFAADETHHLLHDIDRKQHDADRAETFPADRRFFDAVASAVAGSGRIVVVGHGTGQSNEADHLITELRAHHATTLARIVRNIVADLPHLTEPQMVALARHALQTRLISAGAEAH